MYFVSFIYKYVLHIYSLIHYYISIDTELVFERYNECCILTGEGNETEGNKEGKLSRP